MGASTLSGNATYAVFSASVSGNGVAERHEHPQGTVALGLRLGQVPQRETLAAHDMRHVKLLHAERPPNGLPLGVT